MERVVRWFQLEGDTPGERIRQNLLQLLALIIILWIVTVIAYYSFAQFMGETWATVVIFLGAIAVAFQLRGILIPPEVDSDKQ